MKCLKKVPTQYESGQGEINWRYLPKTNEIIWYSERDNCGHLYLYDATTGKLKNKITEGNYVVTKLLKVDERNRNLFFDADGLIGKILISHICIRLHLTAGILLLLHPKKAIIK